MGSHPSRRETENISMFISKHDTKETHPGYTDDHIFTGGLRQASAARGPRTE